MPKAAKLEPETVKALLDEVEWFFRHYRNEAEKNVVMPAFEVHKAKAIEHAIDKLTARQRTVLHLFTGGWGPKGKLTWTGYDHLEGFGPVIMGTEACHYLANKAGDQVSEYCKRLRDKETIHELIEVAKEYVQDALVAFKQHKASYFTRMKL